MGLFQAGHGKSPNRTSNEHTYEIRKLWATGKWTYEQLAIKFNRHPSTIGRLCRGASHRDVAVPQFEKTDAELKAEGIAATRKLCLENGWPIPDDLKTPEELKAEGKAAVTEQQIEQLQATNKPDDTPEQLALKERMNQYLNPRS